MSKVDKAQSMVKESMISKILGNIFDTKKGDTRIVMLIEENVKEEVIFVAIAEGSKSEIEIYDISGDSNNLLSRFRLLRTITLQEVFDSVSQKMKAGARVQPFESSNIDIVKMHMNQEASELTIILGNSAVITLGLTYKKETSENTGETQRVVSYCLLESLTPQLDVLVDRYEQLFDDFIPD